MEISFKKIINASSRYTFVINELDHILFGENGGNIYAYDIKTDSILYTIYTGFSANISIIKISQCRNFLLCGSYTGIINLINISLRSVIQKYIGHTEKINCIVFGKDDGIFFSCSEDHSIKKWDIETGKCINTLNIDNGDVPLCILYDSPTSIFCSTFQGKIFLINIETGQKIHQTDKQTNPSWNLYYINQDLIASNCTAGGSIKIWNKQDLTIVKTFDDAHLPYKTVKSNVTHDNFFIIAEYKENNYNVYIKIWDISTGNCVGKINNISSNKNKFTFSIANCGKKIYLGRDTGDISEYEIEIILKEEKKEYKLLFDGRIVEYYNTNHILFTITKETILEYDPKNFKIKLNNQINNKSFTINTIFTINSTFDKDYYEFIECINIISSQLALPRYNYLSTQKIIENYRFDLLQTICFFYSQTTLSRNILNNILIYCCLK